MLTGSSASAFRCGGIQFPDLTSPEYRRLLRRVSDLGWHVHICAEGERLAALLPILVDSGVNLVVDHLGAPVRELGEGSPGLQATLRALQSGRTWVKMSGPLPRGGRGLWPAGAETAHRGWAGAAALGQRLAMDSLRGPVPLPPHDRLVRGVGAGCGRPEKNRSHGGGTLSFRLIA
jgi:Amidohydrolase